MTEFDKLLEENYQTLRDPKCKEAVLAFMAENESLKGKPINFIKKLTKVSHNLLTSEPEVLINDLPKLYQMNLDGVS